MNNMVGQVMTRKFHDETPVVGAERGNSRERADEQGILFLDAREALDLLESAVDNQGEDHCLDGSGCVYFANYGEKAVPVCIIGVGLSLYDVDLRETFTGYSNSDRLTSIVSPVASNFPGIYEERLAAASNFDQHVIMTEAARDILDVAQNAQDDGRTWGEALDQARNLAINEGYLTYETVRPRTN